MALGGAPGAERILERLASFALFADLSHASLRAVAHEFEETYFAAGERALRRGLRGAGFYLIVEGSATARIDGVVANRLVPGDFFGEISVLLETVPTADIVAETELRCLVLDAARLEPILMSHPRLAYRMLQAEARRLRDATQRT